MNLHHLQITGMGPFAATESIDFDALNESGVFLLTGRTGSGKTTVLDAVSYAIFGSIARGANGDDVVSHHRSIETTPRVVLEATIGGSRLRITRSPLHERPSKRGGGTTSEAQSLQVEQHIDGEWSQVTGRWAEGNELLQKRIGMTAAQFNQVVMLPQGEFARFLDANANDRRELLQRLFPDTDLEWLERWLREEATTSRAARDEKLDEIGNCFQRVHSIAESLIDPEADRPEEEPLLPDHTWPKPAREWIEETGSQLDRLAAETERIRREASDAWDRAAAELHRLERTADLTRQRKEAERQHAELIAQEGWRAETGRVIESARRATTVKLLAGRVRGLETERDAAEAEVDRLRSTVEGHRLVAGIAPEDLPGHRQKLTDHAGRIQEFIRKEVPRREELERRADELDQELRALTDQGPESRAGRARKLLADREAATLEATRSYIRVRTERTHGMAQVLAADLEPGAPCPVCGSPDHPQPAEGAGDIPSEEDEAAAEERERRAKRSELEAREALAETERRITELKARTETELAKCRQESAGLAERESELASGTPDVEARLGELLEAIRLLEGFLTANERLAAARTATATARQEAEAEAKEKGFESVGAALSAAIGERELAELQVKVESYDGQLKIVESRLAGELSGIDPDRVIDLDPAREAERETSRRRDQATGAAEVARNRLDTFRRETAPVPELYEELEPLVRSADRASELERLAVGRNERNMRLSIFVLATRLRQVIKAANVHLAKMTDQRYALVYSGGLAGHGAASGLGIDVHDSHTSESRPTGTLSGGEKFCAALSLALGLAEVVQAEADGKKLESLFIDEGFGTLDAKSLDQVMGVIDSLREGGRSVGLVSHVEELRNRIAAQIRVTGSRAGSTLEVVAG